jgi:protein Tex
MEENFYNKIANSLSLKTWQVSNTLKLFAEGASLPFISRYRKEMTGSLDEKQIQIIREQHTKWVELEKRREAIIKSIFEQGKLTELLQNSINEAESMNELEDLYLPYKQKRKTRASVAREKGLEPLAKLIIDQREKDILLKAERFTNEQVKDVEDALQGARDIISEWLSEDLKIRNIVRHLFQKEARIRSRLVKGKETEGEKYTDYFDYEEKLKRCPSHRYLAIVRGETEGFLRVSIAPDEDPALEAMDRIFLKGNSVATEQVKLAIRDSYKRLLQPSIENEVRAEAKEKADNEAIRVFVENLRQLLMAPPLGQKCVMAIDPGFRTGCKLVCLDSQGNLVHNETIFPHPPQSDTGLAIKKIVSLISAYHIEAIAIGNGTAGRETESFIKKIRFDRDIQLYVVSENGASVYSASDVAREELPEYDVTVRGSVSIGRRLMDPLAELVKIDPKSIGVGQYQHDVDQTKLKNSLDQVVESCVNQVGVNVNTATPYILTYISGLGPQLARNIVNYRKENGPFNSREELKKVPRMGDKAFEQSAGFLRIQGGDNPLDNSAVHPESYEIVKKMAKDLNCGLEDLLKSEQLRTAVEIKKYITEKIGIPTLKDIMEELAKPGRDPRPRIKFFEFDPNIHRMEDLKQGMILPGIVTNITRFGAFVDIGVKQDGLVHVSQLADRFVSDPQEVVQLNQHVQVKVLEVDIARKRIQLSMKEGEA